MSLSAYARHRGCSLTAVQKALATGRIDPLPDGRIDPEVADVQWEERTIAYPMRGNGAAAEALMQSRTIREHYSAMLSKLEYEERRAGLVSADDVKVAAFNTYRRLCDVVLQIPDRLAPVLVAEGNEAAVHTILSSEIRRALIEFVDGAKG